MIITRSQVFMTANHKSSYTRKESEELRFWTDQSSPGVLDALEKGDSINISKKYEEVLAQGKCACGDDVEGGDLLDEDAKLLAVDAKLGVMKQIIEHMTGKRFRVMDPNELNEDKTESVKEESDPEPRAEGTTNGVVEREGWGLEYDRTVIETESKKTQFATSGIVTTGDGREIAFDVSVSMSEERIVVEQFSLRAGDAKLVDPLVVNFSGTAAQLTDSKFGFDLNSDGDLENISFVRQGSGFLVLDRNGDGIATDGSELFGPTTGDGFAELATYDSDMNGWIDEADAVFDELRIWTRDSEGKDILSSLLQQNIGAIYLNNLATPMELEGRQGELNGRISATGIYLDESGGAGTIQQVDLTT